MLLHERQVPKISKLCSEYLLLNFLQIFENCSDIVSSSISVIFSHELQINSDTRNDANYLQSWIKCLRKDPSILKNSLKEANRARNYILHPKEEKSS